ncbi:MAG: hypothetical protein V5A38_14475 [Halolamina sp.]|uniref:hypothetical protein n=1 Tax=Halolamina sp. TaxID=1940283 RepID=UPI002FC3DD9D
MAESSNRGLFVEMLREEWRLHSRMLGGRRFGLFPLAIAVLVAGAVEMLVFTGTDTWVVFAGLHGLALVFGLHTGSIGFVGRDALQNLLGDVTLLVFSGRTLPLSQRRLLATFVVKDVVYYAVLFLLPMAAGTLPAALSRGTIGVAAVALLWITLTTTFVLGIAITLTAVGLAGRGLAGVAALGGLAVAVTAAWLVDLPVLAYTPYGAFQSPTPGRFGGALAVVVGAFLLGGLAFDPSSRQTSRTVGPAFRGLHARVSDAVATKTLLDVHRSNGGLGKVLFSAAVLYAVTAVLVDLAAEITGIAPSVGVSFGAILGLTGFTTYNWLTQADSVEAYLAHPLDTGGVLAGKLRAFLLLGPVVGLAFYAIALARRGSPALEALTGALLLVGVACYIFGVTVYLAGLSPNEFLFDSALFVAFGAAMVVPLVPVLVIAFALAPIPTPLLAGLGGVGGLLALVGFALFRRSIPKWTRHHRQG